MGAAGFLVSTTVPSVSSAQSFEGIDMRLSKEPALGFKPELIVSYGIWMCMSGYLLMRNDMEEERIRQAQRAVVTV